jgi:DNA polymerase III alpha subunit
MQQLKVPALALTDTNALYGALEFIQHCRAARQPARCRFHFEKHSLTLITQNMLGYGNLCRLVTLAGRA